MPHQSRSGPAPRAVKDTQQAREKRTATHDNHAPALGQVLEPARVGKALDVAEEFPLAVLFGREEELVDRVAVAPVEVRDGACVRGE